MTPYNKRARTMVFSETSFDCATVWKADTTPVKTLAAIPDIVEFVQKSAQAAQKFNTISTFSVN